MQQAETLPVREVESDATSNGSGHLLQALTAQNQQLHQMMRRLQLELQQVSSSLNEIQLRQIGVHSPVFTRDWFSHHIPNWNQWFAGVKGQPHLNFLEIGAFEGRSTCWLMQHVLTHPTSRLHVIDPFLGSDEHSVQLKNHLADRFHYNTEPYRPRLVVYEGFSQDILPTLKPAFYDVIYVDGSHYAPDVYRDANMAYDLLKPGGSIIFDDYEWTYYPNPEDNPKSAIDRFVAEHPQDAVLARGQQLLFEKRK